MAQESHVKVGGSWKRVTSAYVKVSGVWRTVSQIYTKVSGVWELTHGVFEINKSGDAFANNTTVTNNVTISISGGVSPYNVSWARISGSTAPSISNASGTTVHWTTVSTGNYAAVWRCAVTDAVNATETVDVNVEFFDLQ